MSLSADGSTVAIGAFSNDGNGSDSGHLALSAQSSCLQNKSALTLMEKLLAIRNQRSLSRWHAVAIGADRNDGIGSDSGLAFIRAKTTNAWEQVDDIDGEAAAITRIRRLLSADDNTVG